MRILILYPFYGELGWELQNWSPHARYVFRDEGPFDLVKAIIRPGREGLYRDFVNYFDYALGFENYSEGNAFVLTKPEAYNHYKKHCVLIDKYVEKLRKEGNSVSVVRLPKSKYRYFRYKNRHKLYRVLQPDRSHLNKWSKHKNAIIFHLRHISRSKKKNTPPNLLMTANKWARKKDLKFIVVGQTYGFEPTFKIPGINLLNKTSLDDLIALFSLSKFVVGSSSGPMHLAAFTRTPHVVWGGGRHDIKIRYLDTWNPFKTEVCYLGTEFNISQETLVKGLETINNRINNAK